MLQRLHIAIRAVLVGCIWLSAGFVLACGGFFAPEPMDQTSQRMIFSVNGDGTITTIQGIGYQGSAEEFVWMLPLPSVPTVDVATVETLDALDNATAPRIIPPLNPCASIMWSDMGPESGMGGGGGLLDEGSVGPYDYVVLQEDSADAIVTWLQDAGYNVPDSILPAIERYVEQDLVFLALKLRPEAAVGDIQPVKLIYTAEKPVISISFAATSLSQGSLPFRVWIMGDTRYMADNYANPSIDFSTFDAENSSIETYNPFSAVYQEYDRAKQRIQSDYNGQAFVTEYAMPAATLANDLTTKDPALVELLGQHQYVTRLEALLSADQMTEDVMFVPMENTAADIPQTVDLKDHVDPFHFWKCSTRDLLGDAPAPDELLEEFSTVNGAHVGYPAGWVESQVLFDLVTVARVFAPEPVTADTIRAFFNGEATPPMFVIFGSRGWAGWSEGKLRDALGIDRSISLSDSQVVQSADRYELFKAVETSFTQNFMVLASAADYGANRAVYDAMLNYAENFAYYADPDLRHTLFKTSGFGNYDEAAWQIGFPAGWREHSTDEGMVAIYPETMTETSAAVPFIRVYQIIAPGDSWKQQVQYLLEAYGISDTATLVSVPENTTCGETVTFNVPFERNGRKGFLQFGRRYYAETSAPLAIFPEYETVLKQSAESFDEAFHPCG